MKNMKLDIIYNEDCLEGMKRLSDDSVDLVVTDPPYGISRKGNFEIPEKNYKRICADWDIDNIEEITKATIKETYRILKKGAAIYITASFHNLRLCWNSLEQNHFIFRNNIVFAKSNAMPIKFAKQIGCYAYSHEYSLYFSKGRVKTFNYDDIKKENNNKQIRDFLLITMRNRASNFGKHKHPSMKPLEIIQLFIKASSNENEIILDPFMGSGTTAIACKRLNRHYIGFEISKEYCEIAKQRLEAEKTLWDNI